MVRPYAFRSAGDDDDDTSERPVPLSKAGRLFLSNPGSSCLWRWMQDGLKGPNGERIRLRFLMVGGRRYIEPSAAREFIAACNAVPRLPVQHKAGAAQGR